MSARALQQYQSSNASSRAMGWAVVLGLHGLLAWALISGTVRKGLDLIKKPLAAVVIQEVIIPPPPPPSTKPAKPNLPKAEAPSPPFIPPPEVVLPIFAAPVIAAVATPPLAPAVIPLSPPEPVKAAVARAEIGVVCAIQVKPEMPRRAIRDGTEGVVRAQALIRNGQVQDVTVLSGPPVFHAAVREAMLQYKCNGDSGEVLAQQEFVFRVQ